jgi:hypothetical protein
MDCGSGACAGKRLERLRRAEGVALGLVDAETFEDLEGGEALYALGDHPLAGAMGLEDGAAHRPAFAAVSAEAVDERLPQLDVADRKPAQEKRIRAALDEAVKGDLTTELGDRVDEGAAGVERFGESGPPWPHPLTSR